MKNILNFFRLATKTPKTKYEFLKKHFGGKIDTSVQYFNDSVLQDIFSLVYLSQGSSKDVENFLLEIHQILGESLKGKGKDK